MAKSTVFSKIRAIFHGIIVISVHGMLFSFPTMAKADALIKNVFVLSEDMNNEGAACITSDITTAYGQAALRKNGVSVEYNRAARRIRLYINVNATRMQSGLCVANLFVQFYFGQFSVIPETNKRIFANFELCNRAYLLAVPAYDFQTRIGAAIEQEVDACVSEINQNAEPIK